ncbi:MAG: hypothetical protein MUD12_09315 [Spirochaetes bacterium]|jgi:hypothetical protein|nr:hypothetical protein [Spirochaetota bacterium]
MSDMAKSLSAGLFLLVILTAGYLFFRVDSIETEFTRGLEKSAKDVVRLYEISSGDRSRPMDYETFVDRAVKRNPGLAMVAVADSYLSLKIVKKNDRQIKSGHLYDSILKDFTGDGIDYRMAQPVKRYYNLSDNPKGEQVGLYLFVKKSGGDKILMAFPYGPGRKLILKIALEALLILILSCLLSAAVYVFLTRRPGALTTISYNMIETPPGLQAEKMKSDPAGPDGAVKEDPDRVLEIMKRVRAGYSLDSVSIYLLASPGSMSKRYELSGDSFAKIGAGGLDNLSIETIGTEMKKSSGVVLDGGRKIIVPLVDGDILFGTMNITRLEPLAFDEISSIRSLLDPELKFLYGLFASDDSLIDGETGLFSRDCLLKKLDGIIKRGLQGESPSSLAVISFFEPGIFTGSEKKALLGLLQPLFREAAGNADLFSLGENVAIIFDGTGRGEAAVMMQKLAKSLSRLRIKLKNERTVRIKTIYAVESVEDRESAEKVLAAAAASLKGL